MCMWIISGPKHTSKGDASVPCTATRPFLRFPGSFDVLGMPFTSEGSRLTGIGRRTSAVSQGLVLALLPSTASLIPFTLFTHTSPPIPRGMGREGVVCISSTFLFQVQSTLVEDLPYVACIISNRW